MTLQGLIEKLERMDPDLVFSPGFGRGGSWRGSYDQVAFAPVERSTVAEMLAHARAAVGSTLHGWKGGEFGCGLHTECNVALPGEYGGDSDRMSVWWAANVETAYLRRHADALAKALKDALVWLETELRDADTDARRERLEADVASYRSALAAYSRASRPEPGEGR